MSKIISYGKQYLNKLNVNSLKKSLLKSEITNSDYCKKFEDEISKLVNCKYTVVCNNGTSALLLSILAQFKKPQNIVAIIPSVNFVAASNIISLLKGKIVFCDINEKTGMVTYNDLLNCIKFLNKKKIKPNLFIPVHYAGDICDLNKISNLCNKKKIKIIEDGCHSFGSYNYKNKKKNFVGSCKYSTATTFSFHPVKNITTVEGGAVTTNSKIIYKKMLLLRSHGLMKTRLDDPYVLTQQTLNLRLGEFNSLIGLSQLKSLKNFQKKRNLIVKWYKKNLKNYSKYFDILNYEKNSIFWHLFVIKINSSLVSRKYSLMKFLRKKNIITQIHYKPLFLHKAYSHCIFDKKQLKGSLIFYKSQLSLPLYVALNEKNIRRICKVLQIFFNQKNNSKL